MDHGYLDIKFTKESCQKDGENFFQSVTTHMPISPTRTPIAHILEWRNYSFAYESANVRKEIARPTLGNSDAAENYSCIAMK